MCSRLHQWQAQKEARALGAVGFRADGAAVLLHNLGGDGKTETGAAMLGGIKRQEEALANFVGEAVAGVGDCDFDCAAIFTESGMNTEQAQQAALHGFSSVVDEVGEGTAQGVVIGENGGQSGLEIALHGDAFKAAREECKRFFDDLVDVAGAGLRRRELRQGGELVD